MKDILRHGPALGFDTCPTESNHRFTKEEAKKTQRIKSRFEHQTASRLYERNVIYTAYNDAQQKELFSKKDRCQSDGSFLSGIFFCKLVESNDGKNYLTITDKNHEEMKISSGHYRVKLYQDILQFLDEYFILQGVYNITKRISCYTKYKRHGIMFYGINWKPNNIVPKENWAMFSWKSASSDRFIVPGQCILFFHLEGINNDTLDDGDYVLIRSLQELNRRNSFIQWGDFCSRKKFYIVNVESLYNSAFVVPDIGYKKKIKDFYFYHQEITGKITLLVRINNEFFIVY